jgi:hypothetical protein
MNFTEIISRIKEFANSPQAIYVYFALIIVLFMIHRAIKSRKVKLMVGDGRFKEPKVFSTAISSPMAVSINGYIGIVPGAFAKPVVVHIKNIKRFEIYFDGHSVANNGEAGMDELLFKDVSLVMEPRMRERTKRVNLLFLMDDDSYINIVLFSGGTRLISVMKESTQKEILLLLSTLADIEKQIKKK